MIRSVATFHNHVKTSRSTCPINASDLINMQIRKLTQYLQCEISNLTIQGEV